MTIEEKLDKVLLELEQYRKKESNLIMTVPQREDYIDLPRFLFLDAVSITKGFYKGVVGTIVAEKEEIPELIDYDGNILESVPVSYGVLIKNHNGEEITVVIDAKTIEKI